MIYKAVINLPTYSKGRGEKKRTNLFSMNIYRNMHYLSLNKVKRDYPKYILFFKGKRKKDIDNYTFPIHKFLMDALVEHEVLADDSYDYVKGFTTSFGDDNMEDNYVVIELNGDEL